MNSLLDVVGDGHLPQVSVIMAEFKEDEHLPVDVLVEDEVWRVRSLLVWRSSLQTDGGQSLRIAGRLGGLTAT